MDNLLLQDGEHALGVARPLRPVETVEAVWARRCGTAARCELRSITSIRGPVEAAFGAQTYWPGPSLAAFAATDRLRCWAGWAAAEAAAHASKPNPISRVMSYLVQAITPEQAPGRDLRIIVGKTAAP
jgi:hypothetical protein